MKKLFVTLFSIICICASFALFFGNSEKNVAFAEVEIGDYIVGTVSNLKDNPYAGASNIKLTDIDDTYGFYLPESYYAKIESINTKFSFYRVSYGGKEYCVDFASVSTSIIAPKGATTDTPAVVLIVKDGETITLDGALMPSNASYKFLGFVDDSNIFVESSIDGQPKFGAVSKSAFVDFNVPYHPIAQAERDGLLTETPDENGNADNSPKTSVALRVILIIGIVIPAVLIAFLLFKPNKNYDNKSRARERKAPRTEYDNDRQFDEQRNYSERDNLRDRDYQSGRYGNDRDYRNDDYRDYRRDDYRNDRDDRNRGYRSEDDFRR